MSNDLQKAAKDPPIVLDAAYVEHLQRLATSAMQRVPDVAERLSHELERATILPAGDMPATVVNIGSEVTFRDNVADRVHTVRLVLPQDADIAERRISILTPIGAALIGLAQGASIDWETRDGETRHLTVTAVRPPRTDADA